PMTTAAEQPPSLTFRQKYSPFAAGWLLCVVLTFVAAALPIGDMVALFSVLSVSGLATATFVVGSGVRRTRRWEEEHRIPERRARGRRRLEEFVRRTKFERRPDESLDEAAKRLRRLAEAEGIGPI